MYRKIPGDFISDNAYHSRYLELLFSFHSIAFFVKVFAVNDPPGLNFFSAFVAKLIMRMEPAY